MKSLFVYTFGLAPYTKRIAMTPSEVYNPQYNRSRKNKNTTGDYCLMCFFYRKWFCRKRKRELIDCVQDL